MDNNYITPEIGILELSITRDPVTSSSETKMQVLPEVNA